MEFKNAADYDVLLLVDESKESQIALKRLINLGVNLTVQLASGCSLPCARLGNTSYTRGWGINFLVSGLEQALA